MSNAAIGSVQSALFGAGNADISAEEIRQFISAPGTTGDQVLDAAIANRVSVKQIAEAMQGQAGFSIQEIASFLKAKGIDTPQHVILELNDAAQTTQTKTAERSREDDKAVLAKLEQERNERIRQAKEQGTLFGRGNEQVSLEQIRKFSTAPGVTAVKIFETALEHRISVPQLVLAMHNQPGWTLGEVRGFLAAQGQSAPETYWSDIEHLVSVVHADQAGKKNMAQVLFGPDNTEVSGQQIRDFVKQVMYSGGSAEVGAHRVLEAAVGHKVSVQQLVQAMRGERNWSSQDISQYLDRLQIQAPDLSYWTRVEALPRAIFSDPKVQQNALDVLFGMGNGEIAPAQIKEFVAQSGLLRRDMLDAALKNGVSVSQILLAMRGKPGWSAPEVRAYLASVGLTAPDSYWKDVNELLKVMYGNDKRDYQKALKAVFGQGNPNITDAEIQNFIRQNLGSGATPEQISNVLLDVAIVRGVSVSQALKAMQGEGGWTPDKLRSYLAAQGLETTPEYWSQVKTSLQSPVFSDADALKAAKDSVFGSGNSALTDTQIRTFYDTPRYLDRESLMAALENRVSVEQYVRAMQSHPEWQRRTPHENLANVRSYLLSVGLTAPEGYWEKLDSTF